MADGTSGDCRKLGSLGTEATARNNVAETTILYACSTAVPAQGDWAEGLDGGLRSEDGRVRNED